MFRCFAGSITPGNANSRIWGPRLCSKRTCSRNPQGVPYPSSLSYIGPHDEDYENSDSLVSLAWGKTSLCASVSDTITEISYLKSTAEGVNEELSFYDTTGSTTQSEVIQQLTTLFTILRVEENPIIVKANFTIDDMLQNDSVVVAIWKGRFYYHLFNDFRFCSREYMIYEHIKGSTIQLDNRVVKDMGNHFFKLYKIPSYYYDFTSWESVTGPIFQLDKLEWHLRLETTKQG
jgi:hypothetical protein